MNLAGLPTPYYWLAPLPTPYYWQGIPIDTPEKDGVLRAYYKLCCRELQLRVKASYSRDFRPRVEKVFGRHVAQEIFNAVWVITGR